MEKIDVSHQRNRWEKPTKKGPPHERAEQAEKLCKLFGEPVKANIGKWLGVTSKLPVREIYRLRKEAEREGRPPKRLFIYLVRQYKIELDKRK